MPYTSNPLVANAVVANVVGAAVVNVLAAPGVGFAFRIVGCQLTINRIATGIVDINLQDGVGNVLVQGSGLSIAGGSTLVAPPIPQPGLRLPTNSPLVLRTNSSIATGSGLALVYYYVVQVT